jgi:hypothetical protein
MCQRRKITSLDEDGVKYTLIIPRHIKHTDHRTQTSYFKPPLTHKTSLNPTPTKLDCDTRICHSGIDISPSGVATDISLTLGHLRNKV